MTTSFSVSAAEFVPMAMRAPTLQQTSPQDPISMFNSQMNNVQQGGGQPAMDAQASAPHHQGFGGMCGTKATVCTPFFRQGLCNDPQCRFAHGLAELDFNAQQQLISMAGGEEFLPIHFTQGVYMPNSQRLFSPSAPNTPSNAGGPKSVVIGHNGHHGGNGGNRGGNGTPSSGGGNNAPWEEVRVTLPSRCHYPHAIGGTYYDYLNVKRHCAPADIEASYRSWRSQGYKAAKTIDQTKADAMDRLVVEARLVLGNPTMRGEYDALLPLEEGAVLPPASSRLNDEDNIW